MAIWDWFFECVSEFRAAGDEERLRLAELHDLGFGLQETDPDGALAAFTEGRQLAERLGEPWWVLFYDVWRVIALLGYKSDFRNVLDLAVHCALEVRKPHFAGHPWRFAAYNNLVAAYVGIDPEGHAEPIQQALAYLDAELPPEPNDDRYVMLGERRRFFMGTDRFEEARAVAMAHLGLLAGDDDPSNVGWYSVSVNADLCWLLWRLGDWDGVAAYAAATEEVSRRVHQSQGELAEALLWQAVLARRGGEAETAKRRYRAATARMGRLRRPPSDQYFDALVQYHELGENLGLALKARERELHTVAGTGQLAYECRVHLKRCRLLARLGKLSPGDLDAARAAARLLRKPAKPLAEIDSLRVGGPPASGGEGAG
jgi:hypothetical protein